MIEVDNTKLYGFRYVDLFCGIGGFHLALNSFGAECVFSSDIDTKARSVYFKNFGVEPSGDILNISTADVPDHEILCAGFPCQPFSISGKQSGFKDPRGKLFFQVVRIAHTKQPKILLLENVMNLLNHDSGKTIKKMKSELLRIGYIPYAHILNSSNFSVPQARKRLYLVGIRKDLHHRAFEFPRGDNYQVSLIDFLRDDYGTDAQRNAVIINREANFKEVEETRVNAVVRVGHVGQGRQGERIYSIHGHAVTLSSQGGGLAGKTGMYKIGNIVRKLFPRECARIMGFPDNFILHENFSSNYSLFGNSVVVDVLQRVVNEIALYLEEGVIHE